MSKNYLKDNLNYLFTCKYITTNELLKITNHSSTGLVSMWKSGERTMKTSDVIKLANFLNLTIDDLVNKDISSLEKTSSIQEVKQKINNLPPSEMSEESKESLISMVDTLNKLNKK